jgi:transglutaminase-like putative cysteine protease
MRIRLSTVETNGKAYATGPYMHAMVNHYWRDMIPWGTLSLPQIFNRIKSIPYRPDPPNVETLMRPYYTMNRHGWGGDCDDKAIALASWAVINRIPYRFVAVKRHNAPTLHHVFTELWISGRWLPADVTYRVNQLGRRREIYAEEIVI